MQVPHTNERVINNSMGIQELLERSILYGGNETCSGSERILHFSIYLSSTLTSGSIQLYLVVCYVKEQHPKLEWVSNHTILDTYTVKMIKLDAVRFIDAIAIYPCALKVLLKIICLV